MAKLNLTVVNNPLEASVYINGKHVRLKKIDGKKNRAILEVPAARVRIDVIRRHEYESPLWFLYAFFFWVIGILGILTPRYKKESLALHFSASFECEGEIDVEIEFFPPIQNSVALQFRRSVVSPMDCDGNVYMPAPNVNKRRMASKAIFALLSLVTLALSVYFILKAIIQW